MTLNILVQTEGFDMDEIKKPENWSIMPSKVRYDEKLKPMERILYCEITSLTHMSGYCFASNNYFAALYNVTPETISRYISHLKERGYIKIDYIYKENSKQILKRLISIIFKTDELSEVERTLLSCYPIDNSVNTYCQNYQYPLDRNVKENSKSINNTLAYIDSIRKSEKRVKSDTKAFTKPTAEELKNYAQEIEFGELYYEPEKFIDYYDSVGWMVGGKTKMKDWKAAVRTWKHNRQGNTSSKPIPEKKENTYGIFYEWYAGLPDDDKDIWDRLNHKEELRKLGKDEGNWEVKDLDEIIRRKKQEKE